MTIFRGEELIFRRERSCETVAAELDAAALGPGQLLAEARYTHPTAACASRSTWSATAAR